MTAFRFHIFVTIAYFSAGLFFLPTLSPASDFVLRKAATPSTSGDLSEYRDARRGQPRHPGKDKRLGLSPLPFRPEPAPGNPGETAARQSALPHQFLDVRALIRKVNQSVVSIRMLDSGSSWSIRNLGKSGEQHNKATGYGSGFIVSENGHIMTNEHVLRNGSQIEVELLDGNKYSAKVVYRDAKNDLALLKINAGNLKPVLFGNSDAVELGEWVVGIGNPYGIGQSIMIGIVSARQRTIPGSGYPPLIQIDAAMNLGNSGGPLFNMEGQVIGINTILLWKSQGIGFATPVNIAKSFLQKKSRARLRADASLIPGPLGPASDEPRAVSQTFNPLDPPWKFKR